MAHALQVGDIVEFTAICKLQNQYAFNVFHFVVTATAGTSQTDAQFSTQLDNLIHGLYKTLLPVTNSYYGSRTQVIKPARFDPVDNAANRGAGTFAAAEPLPPQIAAVGNFKTGIATRSTRGRMYFPAATETDNQATALPSAGYLAAASAIPLAMQTFTAVVTGGNTASVTWGVYSRKLDLVTPITVITMRSSWATMRKRSMIADADAAPVSAVIVVVGNCPVACADVPAVAPRAVIATDGPNDGDARTEAPALAESGVTATAPPKAALIVAPAEALAPSGWTTTPRSAP